MTQQYVGTKIITAWEAESEGKPGYGVTYADGYSSWSPKEVFEEAYIALGQIGELPPHQQRVIAEKAQLDDRLTKLEAFFINPNFAALDAREQDRLHYQAESMREYSEILGDRIAVF